MNEVRTCRFCGEPLDPNDPETLFSVENVFTGARLGDMHLSCAEDYLPPGMYRGWKRKDKPTFFEVLGGD